MAHKIQRNEKSYQGDSDRKPSTNSAIIDPILPKLLRNPNVVDLIPVGICSVERTSIADQEAYALRLYKQDIKIVQKSEFNKFKYKQTEKIPRLTAPKPIEPINKNFLPILSINKVANISPGIEPTLNIILA